MAPALSLSISSDVLDGPSDDVAGLSFERDSTIVHTPDRPLIHDLDALPLPLREIRPPRYGLDGLHYHVDTGVDPSKVAIAAKLLNEVGIQFRKFFIIGHPNESVSEVLRYVDFSLSQGSRNQSAVFFIMTPYPGTETYALYDENRLIKSRDWDLYTNFCAVIETDGISQQTLQALSGALTLRHSLLKRFLWDGTYSKMVIRFLGQLVLHGINWQQDESFTRDEFAQGLWEALLYARGEKTRTTETDIRGRLFERFAYQFHNGDQEPLVLRFDRSGRQERVSLTEKNSSKVLPAGKFTVHFSVASIARLAAWVDPVTLPHDFITLSLAPRVFRTSWIPSLVKNILKMGLAFGAMGQFHLKTSVRALIRWPTVR